MLKSGMEFKLQASDEFWKKILYLMDYFSQKHIPVKKAAIDDDTYKMLIEIYKRDKVDNIDEILKSIFIYKTA